MLKRKIESDREGPGVQTTWYYVVGKYGAVQFMLLSAQGKLHPIDVGVHIPTKADTVGARLDCLLLGGPCIYSGSALRAAQVLAAFKDSGDPIAIWEYLENHYEKVFGVKV